MKTQKLIILLFLFTTAMIEAQTKMISHKSHSGSKQNFKKAYAHNLFDIECSNFGNPGTRTIMILEKVVVLDKEKVVLHYKQAKVCPIYGTNYKNLKETDFKKVTDTLVNHQILNKTHTVEFIKSKRQELGIFFNNPIEEIKFVGFIKD